jgi:YD repeat-containing protein
VTEDSAVEGSNWACDRHGNLLGYLVYIGEQREEMTLIGPDGHRRELERDAEGEVTSIVDTVTGERLTPAPQPDAPRFASVTASGDVTLR